MLDRLVGAELGAVVRVVVEDVDHVVELGLALVERLAHLFGDDAGEFGALGVEKLGDLVQQGRAVFKANLAPLCKGGVGAVEGGGEVLVGDEVEGLDDLVVYGILYAILTRHALHRTTAA